ncbi:uncharacterized protein (TIGR02680 family) [Saccharopolyspora lacisalsi]|uniref:Nuclease SbcCD subunit C n=1 Tax=Halosaccharopolyspora lacisalsi TaxID=1000566 RepID=A0A839DXS2_9PSEU|nr:TIGR02680 family protein [Halosaccharopolyspora lacisalsi]MBA8825529.1 uncharacterized protein (TIGR02680 family) [Halosaccharopolyspora lacisalsi]
MSGSDGLLPRSEGHGTTRWKLHRGGIVNIWQYGEQTFALDGGRAVFQGANGAGKSRTLELLLPLCLDGDLHQIGSKGFDTVSLRRLMLDEYTGGPNRIGYAWIELHRTDADGDDEFLTCGVGIKASGHSKQISDSWRFITDERVADRRTDGGLKLIGAGEVPLGPAQLRESLGADCVLDEQAFRARIAATVYGVPAARYGDLLHLQRTLRNPEVGLKILEGQLEQILSEALPPPDPELIERLASSFEDLESIRDNILRLTDADGALKTFLDTYSDYALAELRDRARTMRTAEDGVRELRAELDDLRCRLSDKQRERAEAEQAVTEAEKRESELDSGLRTLRAHSDPGSLYDRQRLVDDAHDTMVAALDTASRNRAQEQRSVEAVVGLVRRLAGDTEAAERAAQHAKRQLNTAGLDDSPTPRLPEVPTAHPTVAWERVRTAPESEPDTVERPVPPEVDVEGTTAAFHEALTLAEQAATAARERGAHTLTLHQQALDLDARLEGVAEVHQQIKQAKVAATDAVGRRNQARQELSEAARSWLEDFRSWAEGRPSTAPDEPVPDPPGSEQLIEDPSIARQVRDQVRRWAQPWLHRARQVATDIEQELAVLRSHGRGREEELSALRAGTERTPARAWWVTAERGDGHGTAFYRLVDFAPGLTEEDRAGLEAALESSGLLNAWVTADGVALAPGTQELLAAPDHRHGARGLDELLVPATEPGCPVSSERVAALLAAVPIDGSAGLSVAPDGSWRTGVLSGTWHKRTAEYVGAEAREAGRKRRIAELETELARLRSEVGEAERRYSAATEQASDLERYVESLPDDGDLLTAHARLSAATEIAAAAENEAARLTWEHEQAEQRLRAARSELVRAAGELGLSAETRVLESAHHAAFEARDSLDGLRDILEGRCLTTLSELHGTSLHHDVAVTDRAAAETRAERCCHDHAEKADALAELRSTVGGESQRTADRVAALEREHADLRARLPQLREAVTELRVTEGSLSTEEDGKRTRLAERESSAEAATEAFRQALRVPGLWSAVSTTAAPSDPSEVADLVLADSRPAVTAARVQDELHVLKRTLGGGYDISAAERHGLMTVTVTSERGPQPVAEAARDVTERLTEQRGYLDERHRSVFTGYLVRDLVERLREQIAVADDLCTRMNEVLDGAHSSQGVHVRLEWRPSAALDDDLRRTIDLVRAPFAERDDEQDALLRRVFTDLIETERDSASGGYAEILSRALDYRRWYDFTVRVRDTDPEGKPRVRRLRQLSSGETRLVSYVTLFAAASAFYDTIAHGQQGPLRLVLLDEAFERLDDPTVARMLGLLVDLDMDWVITWPSGWGVSPKIPRMHIYNVLRPRSGHGIACAHTTWDGRSMERAEH